MTKIETKIINVEGRELPIRFSINAFMYFSEEYNGSLNNLTSLKDALNLFYCAYKAGCDYQKKSPELTHEDFLQLIDDYPEVLTELTQIVTTQISSKKK